MAKEKATYVLSDRSRDGATGGPFHDLHEHPGFRVTENERRLSPGLLKPYQVLEIGPAGGRDYTADELDAIDGFVRRGGGLILAPCAGSFERGSARSIADSAAQQVANRFGVQFLSPDDADGEVHDDWTLCRGYRRDALRLLPAEPLDGYRLDDLALAGAAPVVVPDRAEPILRHKRTREVVAASLPHGRGRVLVANCEGFGAPSSTIAVALARWLAQGRRPTKADTADFIRVPRRTLERGTVRMTFHSVPTDRAEVAIGHAARIARHLARLGHRPKQPWRFELVPGAGERWVWDWWCGDGGERVGADVSDPRLVFGLATAYLRQRLHRGGFTSMMYRSCDPGPLIAHLALKEVERAGFVEEADAWRQRHEAWPDGDRDPRTVDLGWWRAEQGPSPGMWLWAEIEAECGDGILERWLRSEPVKFPWKSFPHWDVFTELDVLVYYLSLAAKKDLYPWFAERGQTVHPLPLIPTTDRKWDDRCLELVRKQFDHASQPLSERFDAARVLMRSRIHKQVRLDEEAKLLGGDDPGDRLVAALRLARARDARGADALLKIATSAKDDVHAAIAAANLCEMGDDRAAERLVKLAAKADSRFQFDANAALTRVGRSCPTPMQIVKLRHPDPRECFALECVAMVDGYLVANVFSSEEIDVWPNGTAVSKHFVNWVHTAPKWRRKGLSRKLVQATMADRINKRSACSALDTGTKNVAHTIYRSVGLVDFWVWQAWRHDLSGSLRAPAVKGVKLRRMVDRDLVAASRVLQDAYGDYYWVKRHWLRSVPLRDNELGIVAEKGGKIVGVIRGVLEHPDRQGKRTARIRQVAARGGKPDETERIARALATRFAAEAKKGGATRVTAWSLPEYDAVRHGFQAAGFSMHEDGSVELWRLNDLQRLLEEITPLLESRLKEKKRGDWCGTIAFRSPSHKAALRLDAGAVAVLSKPPNGADIGIETDDESLSLLLLGRRTAFESMLQTRLRFCPRANKDVTTLVEALFPKVKMYPLP
jgi:GNAT superfamily N-acetyltransferase